MLKKLLAPVLIATSLAAPISARAQLNLNLPLDSSSSMQGIPMIWTAFSLGGRSMTSSYDVKKWMEVAHLTDTMLVEMFKEANGDYGKYEEIKDKWLAPRLKDGIKQMAYIRMVQDYATRPLMKKDWKAFTITQSDYFKKVQDMETKALRSLLDEGKGIVYARQKFGEQLIEAGYPHKSGQTAEELYWDWYNLQKERIKEHYRIKEVEKFEYITALGYAKEFYVRPVEIFDFAKEMESFINNKINNKRISQGEASQIATENPGMQVMLKGVTFYGPETTELAELRNSAPAVYNDFLANIDSNVIQFINSEYADKILKYESIAEQMAKKYVTTQKLDELSEEMKKQFLLSKDYNRLMMSKIYELAIAGIENGTYEKDSKAKSQQSQMRDQYISAISGHALEFLKSENALLEVKNVGVRLEDNFSGKINEDFHANAISGVDTAKIKESAYLDEVRKLAHWVLKFQIKKASLNTTPLAVAELYDRNTWEGQDRIEKYLKNKQYEDKVRDFKENTLRGYWNGILRINPTGRDYLSDIEAVNFVLGIENEEINQTFDWFNQN